MSCHTNKNWLSKIDSLGHVVSSWLTITTNTVVHCVICNADIDCCKKGFSSVMQHVHTKKHKGNAESKLVATQLRLAPGPSCSSNSKDHKDCMQVTQQNHPISLICKKDDAIRQELQWVMKCISSNFPVSSCDGIKDLFQCMFPNGIADAFTLGRSKAGYLITEALGPHFREIMLKDACKSFYTLCYDETTNSEGFKELQICVRFWSTEQNKVVFKHLETFFIGHATSEILVKHLQQAIDNAGMSFTRMLMLASDGPNVNKKVFRIMNDAVKEHRGKGLLDIGTCNLHVVHNSFAKALTEFGSKVSDLALNVFTFFNDWPSRWEDYSRIQTDLKIPPHRFLKHVESRWLSLSVAAKRLLEQWPGLISYFINYLPKNSNKKLMETQKYKNIVTELRCPTAKVEICFVIESAETFENFSKVFQKQEPLIHVLYEEVSSLITILMGRALKSEVIVKLRSKEIKSFSIDDRLPLKKVYCGDKTEKMLETLIEANALRFRKKAQDHFIAAAEHLLNKSVASNDTTRHFKCLKPSERKKDSSGQAIVKIARVLPVEISESQLCDEWRLLKLESNISDTDAELPIEIYWMKIFSMKNACNLPKYPTVQQVVKSSLSLAHGSADVERGFSLSGRILSPDRASMSVKTLNAKLYIKDGLKMYSNRPEHVPISPELLRSAQFAHKKFKENAEQERREAENNAEKQKIREEERRLMLDDMKAKEKSRQEIKKLEEEVKQAKSSDNMQKNAADKLLDEASRRLKKAVSNKNMEEIQIAEGLLQGARALRKESQEKEEAVQSIQKKIDKRKSNLISSFFSKTPRLDETEDK